MKSVKRVATVVSTAVLGTLVGGLLVGATPPAPKAGGRQQQAPTVARGHQDTPVVDDDLMVSDPQSPRVLHSKRPGVIDRAWIERTAMPRFTPGLLEALDAAAPARGDSTLRSPEAPPLASAALSISGNVFVIEGDSSVAVRASQLPRQVCPGQGQFPDAIAFNHANGSNAVLGAVLGNLGDNYDFVTVFSTFDDPCTAAYYFPIKQDIDGLGKCDFENGQTFGCLFDQTGGELENLQGFVFMNSLQTWKDTDFAFDGVAHDVTDFDSSVFSTLGQEVAHRWGSGLRFVDPRDDRVSELLLGRDASHWAAYVDTDASIMDGWDWSDDADDGRYELQGEMDVFSTLDLYTMGALPVAAAKPFFVLDDARYAIQGQDFLRIDGEAIPAGAVLGQIGASDALLDENGMNIGATGERVPVTIQDVVDAEGNRCPDPDAAQKTFRQAVVLVTRPGQTAASVASQVAELNLALQTWEAWWLDRTNKQLRLCTVLEEECTHAEMSVVNGAITHEGDSFQPGASGTLSVTVAATGRTVENVVITFERLGESADFVELTDRVELGDIDVDDEGNGEESIDVDVALKDDYPCGFSSLIRMTVTADNAATVVEELRTFPGLKTLAEEKFADKKNSFAINVDDKDSTTDADEGALVFTENVELTCDMTQRSPERDASADNNGAAVTGPGTDHVPNLIDDDAGEGAELAGDTSLWSPSYDLKGTRDPEIRFSYWFDGEEGDELLVQLSGDREKTFKTGIEIKDSTHGWVVNRISVRDVFGEVPEDVTVRFIFKGDGQLEGGIDDVRLLDYDGQCLSVARGCGCDASGAASPATPLAMLIGLLALARGTSRRRRAPGTGTGTGPNPTAGRGAPEQAIIDGDTTPVL